MKTLISSVIKFKKTVFFLTLVVTAGLLFQLKSLQVIIDPDSVLPQTHPYIATGNLIEKVFGNKFTVVIGVTPKQGDIFQENVLKRVLSITQKIQNSPIAVKNNITSLASRKTKNIKGNAEGMQVLPLMEKVPSTPLEFKELKRGIDSNPVYENLMVSKDYRTTLIVAEFKKTEGGFQAIDHEIQKILAEEKDENIKYEVSGITMFLSLLEKYSARMGFLFPLALIIIGLIHYEAFRTVQALILPLVTALLAVLWSVGFLGILKEPFDVFNSSTPILILAIAAGHAVQILKRYYEEYANVKKQFPNDPPKTLSEKAVLESLTKVGPVMLVACTVAALGFFSLMIFEIKSIRTFGIFTGVGVLSALILELTFIPALRVMLPPPGEVELKREAEESFWDRLTKRFYNLAINNQKTIFASVGALVILMAIGGYFLKVENSTKEYFSRTIKTRIDDDSLNSKMAGTNTFYLMIKGKNEDDIKRPDVLKAMEDMQHFLETKKEIGKTISIVDFIKKMNQSMNEDRKEFYQLPISQDLVAQYLLLYSNSGDPTDFDTYVDYGYKNALITAFSKTESSSFMENLTKESLAYSQKIFPKDITVSAGGGSLGGVALNQIMIHEKILNIIQIMAAVFIVSSLVFRSFFAGVLILVPLIAAVVVNFGIMGLFGIPLQIATALVSAMAVGIGADYGIYMSYRMREEIKKTKSEEEEKLAIEKSFKSAGKATLFVSTAVAGGFGVLMLSIGFNVHFWMGLLIALAMLVSSSTALTLFPALIFKFKPKYIFGTK